MTGIFKAYDIRGVYPSQLNDNIALGVGKAFGTFLLRKSGKTDLKVCVGRDVRKSSPALFSSFIDGIISTGVGVFDVGILPTPAVVFSIKHLSADAGIAITASHNLGEYNGIKFYDGKPLPISYEMGIDEIEKIFKRGDFLNSVLPGFVEKADTRKPYSNHLMSNLKIPRSFNPKIVVECFNGATSKINTSVLRESGADVIELNCEEDGNFPNNHPDPSRPGALDALAKSVVENGASAGFAFDGDGDRFALVDERGKVVDSKKVFSILIRHTLKSRPQSKIVFDILSSDLVNDTIKSEGGVPVLCRTGRSYIAQASDRENASIGGEMSGHYYFRETFMTDDALFAGLKILENICASGKKISELYSDLPEYFYSDSRVPIRESLKLDFIEGLKNKFRDSGRKVETIDGVKVFFDDGWAVFRPSNTEPKISVVFEGRTRNGFENIKKIVDGIVETVPF